MTRHLQSASFANVTIFYPCWNLLCRLGPSTNFRSGGGGNRHYQKQQPK